MDNDDVIQELQSGIILVKRQRYELMKEVATLKQQRDDLLTACKLALEAATVKLDTYAASEEKQKEVVLKLEAAIAKCEA